VIKLIKRLIISNRFWKDFRVVFDFVWILIESSTNQIMSRMFFVLFWNLIIMFLMSKICQILFFITSDILIVNFLVCRFRFEIESKSFAIRFVVIKIDSIFLRIASKKLVFVSSFTVKICIYCKMRFSSRFFAIAFKNDCSTRFCRTSIVCWNNDNAIKSFTILIRCK
jgi:signal transduction histidine kinase